MQQSVKHLCVIAFCLLSTPIAAFDKETEPVQFEQTQLSCSVITSEHLTTLQLYQRGLPLSVALETLPDINRAAKKRVKYIYDMVKEIGILNAYADINTNYARCSTLVYQQQGKPAVDRMDYGYYYCSGENKLRYEIILNADKSQSLEQLIKNTPDTHLKVAINYYQLIASKGILAAFDLTANNLKSCLNHLNQ